MPNHQAALRYIAVFKFIKAISLVLVAVVAFGFVRTPRLEQAAGWIRALPIQTGRALLLRGAEALLNAKPRRLELIGAAAPTLTPLCAGLATGHTLASKP